MDELSKHFNKIKIPGPNDKVYKDECVLSFDTPVNIFGIILKTNLKVLIFL